MRNECTDPFGVGVWVFLASRQKKRVDRLIRRKQNPGKLSQWNLQDLQRSTDTMLNAGARYRVCTVLLKVCPKN